jgi:hypothetical protein
MKKINKYYNLLSSEDKNGIFKLKIRNRQDNNYLIHYKLKISKYKDTLNMLNSKSFNIFT